MAQSKVSAKQPVVVDADRALTPLRPRTPAAPKTATSKPRATTKSGAAHAVASAPPKPRAPKVVAATTARDPSRDTSTHGAAPHSTAPSAVVRLQGDAGDPGPQSGPQTAERPRVRRTVSSASGEMPALIMAAKTTAQLPIVEDGAEVSFGKATLPRLDAPPIPLTRATDPAVSTPRAQVHARPVTRKDTALVVRTSRKLGVVTRATITDLATVTAPSQTVIVPAPRRLAGVIVAPSIVLAPKRLAGRSRLSTLLVTLLSLVVVFTGLATVIPYAASHIQQKNSSPTGALLAIAPGGSEPSGPWDTSAGSTDALGQGGGAGPGVNAPGSAGIAIAQTAPANPGTFTASPGAVFISAPPLADWPPSDVFMEVPAHPAFRVNRPADGYYWWAFGQCTWWAQYARRDENLTYIGDAREWAYGAQQRGYRVGTEPAVNSTVVFWPGVQGAGGAGHVAHVEAVYPGGWFLLSEMNFYWNSGGWGRVDYRYAHSGWGVSFIY